VDALDKILLAAGAAPAVVVEDDPAADLVAAASGLLTELVLELAKADSDDDGDGPPWMKKKGAAAAKGKGKKKLPKGKGDSDDDDDDESDEDEDEDDAEVKKKVKAAALASAALLALSGLDSRPAGYDWVEATSAPLSQAEALRLASGSEDHPAPYGDVEYADPGYRGKKRYPIDAKHIHAALSYFSQAKNRSEYTASQVKAIWGRIKAAAKKHGVEMADKTAAATLVLNADTLLALAGQPVEGGVPMQHPPFTGTHNHPHSVMGVHSHQHMHNNDSHHACGNGASAW
jgi:hypothetical protein